MTKIHTYAAPLLGLATLAALGLTARPAAAQITINFDNFDAAIANSQYGYVNVGPTYSNQGFTFTARDNNFSAIAATASIGDGEISFSDGRYTSLTQDNGQTFSLTAIDLGPSEGNATSTNPSPYDGPVTFTGTKADGAQVVDIVTMTSASFQKFTFSNLTDLQSLTFRGTYDPVTKSAADPLFDNVVLTPMAAVPEAGTSVSMGLLLGLGGLLLCVRKRKAQEPLL